MTTATERSLTRSSAAKKPNWVCSLISHVLLVAGLPAHLSYDTVLAALLQLLIFLANLAGGLIVGVATIRGLITYLYDLISSRGSEVPKEAIRLSLGRSLALALEFQLGADILATALNPTRTDIEVLAAIVILRTVLNFFLQKELEAAQRREAMASSEMGVSKGANRSRAVPLDREPPYHSNAG